MPPTMIDTQALRDEIAKVEADAKTAFVAFNDAKTAAAAAGADLLNEESEAFKNLDETGKAYRTLAQKHATMKDRLLAVAESNGTVQTFTAQQAAEEIKTAQNAEQWAGAVVEGKAYKELAEHLGGSNSHRIGGSKNLGEALTRAELKTLVTGASNTSGGAFLRPDWQPYQALPERPPSILDLVTVGQTNSDTVEYPRQTSFPTAAAFTAEATTTSNGTKPEGAMAWEVVTEHVHTIAELMPITRRAFADAAQLQTYIEAALRYDLRRVLENDMVTGDGTGEHLTGLEHVTGAGSYVIGTSDASETMADAIHRGITVCEIANESPTAIAMHPTDWETIRLGKDDDGNYIYGPPSTAGDKQLWGLPVVTSTAFTQGLAYVANFRAFTLWIREGANILVSDSHSDWFAKNILALLCEGRYAMTSPRPKALTIVDLVP